MSRTYKDRNWNFDYKDYYNVNTIQFESSHRGDKAPFMLRLHFKMFKLKRYTSQKHRGHWKFTPELSSGRLGISKLGKLVTKNANRSLKKSARQEACHEINLILKNNE